MKSFYLVAALLCLTISSFAQITFEKTYPLQIASIGNFVKQTYDGGYILGGTYVTKTTDSGIVEWIYPQKADYVNTTTDSGYIVLSNNGNVLFTKLDQQGDTIWTRTYNEGIWAREAYSIEQTADGGYIVAGRHQDVTGSGMMLLKLNSQGYKVWRRTYTEPTSAAFCYGRSVHQTSDGGYILAGYTYIDYYDSTRHKDVFIVKTDSMGIAQWIKNYGGSKDEYAYEIHAVANGNYILAGSQYDSVNNGTKMYLLKLNTQGDTIWTRTYGNGSHMSEFKSVWPTTYGSYIAAGFSNMSTSGGTSNVIVFRIQTNGNQMWSKEFGGADADGANAIQQTADGGFILTGLANASTISNGVMYLIKMDSVGNVSAPLSIPYQPVVETNILLYPNPTNGELYVETALSNTQIRIYNVIGKVLYTQELTKGKNALTLKSLAKGVYVYHIANDVKVLHRGQLILD